jgi:hypothetical protein
MVEIGDCFIFRESGSFTVTKITKRVGGSIHGEDNITVYNGCKEIRFYDAYGSEDSILGVKISEEVYNSIERMANNMLESIKITKERTFDKMTSHLDETVGEIPLI